MLIKVCGLNDPENISQIIRLNFDLIGFIFYRNTPRYFDQALSYEAVRQIPKSIKKVGVFVNQPTNEVLEKVAYYDLDFVQLHGTESADYCEKLATHVKIIKAISVKDKESILKAKAYFNYCDHLLFDTSSPNHGGSGLSFDWRLLQTLAIEKPFFISGGISLENFKEIKKLEIDNFCGIDLNSKFEIKPGLKDLTKLKLLIQQKDEYIGK